MGKRLLVYSIVSAAILATAYCATFYHLDIDKGNKWSTFFSFISALGIFIAIITFINDVHLRKKEESKKKSLFANSVMDEYSKIIDSINKNSSSYHGVTIPKEGSIIIFNKFYGGYYVNDNGKIRCIRKIVTTLPNLKKDALVYDHEIYHLISGIENDIIEINEKIDLSCLSGSEYDIKSVKELMNNMKLKHNENHINSNKRISKKYTRYLTLH